MIVTDTGALLAFFDQSEPQHDAVQRLIEKESDPLVVSPFVIVELDYLIGTQIGVREELRVLGELAGGAYVLPAFDAADVARATSVIERYQDQAIGVADASIVVLADRYATKRVLTLDHRHFNVLRPLSGGRFSLLP